MARRRFRHGRRGHAARKWVGLAGKIIGGVVIAGPAIQAVQQNINNPSAIPHGLVANYTGFQTDTGQWNSGQAATGIGSVAAGLILMKVFSYVAKRF